MNQPSGITVSVLRDARLGDCTNSGLSSRHDELLLILPDGGPFTPSPTCPAVVLHRRKIFHLKEAYLTAYPADYNPDTDVYMFGGNFITSSDSRFPGLYPIPIHDRKE
jgi:hypothetical protein